MKTTLERLQVIIEYEGKCRNIPAEAIGIRYCEIDCPLYAITRPSSCQDREVYDEALSMKEALEKLQWIENLK